MTRKPASVPFPLPLTLLSSGTLCKYAPDLSISTDLHSPKKLGELLEEKWCVCACGGVRGGGMGMEGRHLCLLARTQQPG